MSRIFKRGGIWYIDFQYKGRRIRQSLKTRSKRVADLALKNTDVQVAREELKITKQRRISFREFCKRFLRWYEAQNSEKSFRDYDNLFRFTIVPFFGDYILKDINAELIEDYKILRSKSIKSATVNKELTALKHLFNKAIQWNYLTSNPLTSVRRMKVSQKKFRFLTLEEINIVLDNCSDIIRPVILTAIHTGLRKSELFRLEWKDVDFERQCITVTAKGEEHTKNYLNREIPMTMQLIECLHNLEMRSNWVFVKEDGERYSGWIRKSIESAARRAGIKRFTLHDLRHTFASHLVMEGIDLPTVQRLMGHANVSTTMIYAHLAPDHLMNAIKRFGTRLENGPNLAQDRKDTNLSRSYPFVNNGLKRMRLMNRTAD